MVEGRGSKTFSRAKRFLYTQPSQAHRLLEKITTATISYLKMKIEAGADLVQLFDSWAGILSPVLYREFSLPYLQAICEAIEETPVTVFAKGAWFALPDIGRLPCQVVGLDWTADPVDARRLVGEGRVLQGNLDPCLLYAAPEVIQLRTSELIVQLGGPHIVNLGHGLYPDTPLENVRLFVNTAKAFRYAGAGI